MSEDPAGALAKLSNDRLGVDVDPVKMATFIWENWARLSLWAHQIHDGTDGAKAGAVE
jgi:hypothetical protein